MKPFRILHAADLQLGKQQYGSFLRTQDFAAVLPQIVTIAEQEKVDLIVLAGDIFDSYDPDSYSCREFRKFIERVEEIETYGKGPPRILAVEGNHEHSKANKGGGVGRIDGLTDNLIRPDPNIPLISIEVDPEYDLNVAAGDWMPATKVPEFLASLPEGLQLLIMHQSCEGFIPSIGQTELKLEQLKGKAKLVLLGDLHIQKTLTLDGGTVVTYPGSTELCSSSEPLEKSVSIINFDIEGNKVLEVRQVSLKTRLVLKLRVFDEFSLADADGQLRQHAADNPLVFLTQNAAMRPLVDQKMEEWRTLGLTLIQQETAVEIKETESYAYSKDSADREMEVIVGERLQKHPAEQAAAVALWKTPGAAGEICQQLEREIRQTHL